MKTATYTRASSFFLLLLLLIHRVSHWRHSNLWSRYDLRFVRHDVVPCEVNWWRFVALFK